MAKQRIDILFPPGRMVFGSLYKPRTTDFEGKPKVVKNGPNVGQPTQSFDFGVAIAKVQGEHWAASAWGKEIWQCGHTYAPNAGQMPTFAWKVTDGDSTVPNKKGIKPSEREGYPGHWIVSFSSSFDPKVYNGIGLPAGAVPPLLPEPDAVNPGDYVQVFGNVSYNESVGNPGVFINHGAICLVGYGTRISSGMDVASIGFGGAALPAGASAMPVGGAMPPAPSPAAAPAAALPPAPAMPAAPAVHVQPNATILAGGAPPLPPGPPAAAGPVMTAKAEGMPYADWIKRGWTDAQLREHGYVV